MDSSTADDATTGGMDPGREEEDASAGGAPNPGFVGRFLDQFGEKEDDDAEDSGGGSGADDDASAVYPGTISNDSILLPSEPTNAHLASLLRVRKLNLVLDLDHTLINSIGFHKFSPTEQANGFTEHIRDDPRRGLFRLESYHTPTLTKLRPFVHDFLREASAMFEMHVYTLGGRDYARAVVRLLDPDGIYFGERIISSAESPRPNRKSIEAVVGSASASAIQRAAVVILDDTARVWEGQKDNLIEMERYLYFASDCRKLGSTAESLAESERDESERNGALAVALGILQRVHKSFFFGAVCDGTFSDVREVIRNTRHEVLSGCTVVFTGVTPREVMWRRAEQLGATCTNDVGPEVTHVVAGKADTSEAQWAQKNGKFLVNPKWINTARFRWSKPKEEEFPVKGGS